MEVRKDKDIVDLNNEIERIYQVFKVIEGTENYIRREIGLALLTDMEKLANERAIISGKDANLITDPQKLKYITISSDKLMNDILVHTNIILMCSILLSLQHQEIGEFKNIYVIIIFNFLLRLIAEGIIFMRIFFFSCSLYYTLKLDVRDREIDIEDIENQYNK